jgi:hypothetical protein
MHDLFEGFDEDEDPEEQKGNVNCTRPLKELALGVDPSPRRHGVR